MMTKQFWNFQINKATSNVDSAARSKLCSDYNFYAYATKDNIFNKTMLSSVGGTQGLFWLKYSYRKVLFLYLGKGSK